MDVSADTAPNESVYLSKQTHAKDQRNWLAPKY